MNYIENLEPGYIARRRYALVALARAYLEAGFFPEPISDNDISCFWIRLQPITGDKPITVGGEFKTPDKTDFSIFKLWAKHEIQ